MPETYCIKPGYKARTTAETIETEPGSYWQPWRIAQTMQFQYDVYRLAHKLAEAEDIETVADVGCGVGAKLHHFFQWYSPTAFDQDTVKLVARQHCPSATFRAIDLESPEMIGETFDLVICADVIEHLLDPDPCMEFLRKITGKYCVFSTPERDIVRGPDCMASEKDVHVREWNKAEFAEFVTSRGFEIVTHDLIPPAKLDDEALERQATVTTLSREFNGCQYVVCRPRL